MKYYLNRLNTNENVPAKIFEIFNHSLEKCNSPKSYKIHNQKIFLDCSFPPLFFHFALFAALPFLSSISFQFYLTSLLFWSILTSSFLHFFFFFFLLSISDYLSFSVSSSFLFFSFPFRFIHFHFKFETYQTPDPQQSGERT